MSAVENPPLVSVVVPAFNAEATLRRALASVAAQNRPGLETIVVDDGSTDATARIAETFGGGVRLVRQANAGAAGARNRGVSEARGEFVAFLDADDEYLPGRIARGVAPMLEDPGVAITHCRAALRRPDGIEEVSGERFLAMSPFRIPVLLDPRHQSTPTTTVRREAFLEAGGFDTGFTCREDNDLWMRIHEARRFVNLPEVLVRVHVNAGSLSKRTGRDRHEADFRRMIARAFARRPDLYEPHRREIEAYTEWLQGMARLTDGDRRGARRRLWRALRRKPGPRLFAFWLTALAPAAALEALRALRRRRAERK